MPRLLRVPALAALAIVFLLACAGNPGPGDPEYPYNLSGTYNATFVVDGDPFEGTMELSVAKGGAVSGKMAVRSPATIDGDITGTVAGDTLRFASNYTIRENGCSGVARGTGRIAAGGASVEGTMDVADGCAGGTMAGTFTLKK